MLQGMAEIALGLVGPAIDVVKCVGTPILRQFKYLCCFTTNITNLKNEAEILQDAERDLHRKVDAARNDVRLISSTVETWLKKSEEIKAETDGILNEVPNVEGGCLKLRARFSLSKRAVKTADRLKKHRDECIFSDNSISLPGPPPATKTVPLESSYEDELKSRKQIEDGIMTTLRGEDVNMMGICGMGGLGKTTMAKRIMKRAKDKHESEEVVQVFEEVVMAVVSQSIDKLKIQLDIAEQLGLKLEGKSPQADVQKLHERLSTGTKRTLVILDDVWETLKLEDLGIPLGHKGCTILLTSRFRDVLSGMDVPKENIIGMELLSEEESWFLFKEKVGTHADDTKLNSIAKEVVNECGGLPIALITVGSALKDKVNVSAWKSALRQLKRHDPDIPDFIKKVYNPLELSYKALERKYKLVFLLCCLYPEDADIPLERLTYFCMGLRLFKGGMVEERDRMHSLIDVLKDRSLLLGSHKGDNYVRMHDVVRDVCIHIATKPENKYISGDDSSLQRYEFDPGYALLQKRNSSDKEIKFDGIRDLYVLSIERCLLLTSLPFTQRPNNLITLVLDSCERLKTLSVVGELVNLEILICRYCNSIEELPPEIQGLNQLKVLDLTWCRNLQRIGRGIISNLKGLEELKMMKSFKKWEGEDREERENAGLRELEALTNLRCLEIEIEDLALAAENIRLSSEVDRFTIKFLYESYLFSKFDEYLSNKKMCLNWEGATCLGYWIKVQLLRDTECLMLVGNGANEVGECESMKKVVTSSMDKGGATVFPSPENLLLFELPKLEEICDDRISSNSFQNLKILTLYDLPVLKQLWMSSQKDFLPQLEVLDIENCGMMKTVFLWKGEDGNENTSYHHITKIFPKLKMLELFDLPNLISLCQGIEGIEFPLLGEMKIYGCEKMKGMVANGVTNNENNSGGTHHIFCESRVSFGCLKKLRTCRNPFCSNTIHVSIFNGLEELVISNCAGSRSLFTSSMAGNLVNLKELSISGCKEMVEVIKDEEEKGMSGGRQRALLFPKLQKLMLLHLPNLLSFCEWKCDVEFPSLKKVDIHNCPNMKNFTLGSLAASNLETFFTDLHLQVPFSTVKELRILRTTNPLNCYQIKASVFDRLEVLKIEEYEGSMSLFSSSITGNLVNLMRLDISFCYKMVKVIEEKEEEKEKVVSGAQRTTILFPKLQKIELRFLHELVTFCEWKCDVELPSLTKVVIYSCYNMKSFTLGPLNTPKLESVGIDFEKFAGVKDLNDILQQQYNNRRKEKQVEEAGKKKGGEEEQERKGETEEEQNSYFFQPFDVETSEVATQREVAAEWPELSGFTWPKPTLIFHICLLVFSFLLVVALIVLFV